VLARRSPKPSATALTYGEHPAARPLPAWETIKPGDIFRVFERGGRNILNLFPRRACPTPSVSCSAWRSRATGHPSVQPRAGHRRAHFRTRDQHHQDAPQRSAHLVPRHQRSARRFPQLRLRKPATWSTPMTATRGTPGPTRLTATWARRRASDPTIPRASRASLWPTCFTRAIPTSQCMVCHMHQPNMFVNTYLGYTMWDYESDAAFHVAREAEVPERQGASGGSRPQPRGGGSARSLGRPGVPQGSVWDRIRNSRTPSSPTITAMAGTSAPCSSVTARASCSTPRARSSATTIRTSSRRPCTCRRSTSTSGMHCVDCHFAQDSHGNGHIYGEVAAAVQIDCKDCHGTVDAYPESVHLRVPPPCRAARICALRNPDGKPPLRVGGRQADPALAFWIPELEWESQPHQGQRDAGRTRSTTPSPRGRS
jgi:hypothetical protein